MTITTQSLSARLALLTSTALLLLLAIQPAQGQITCPYKEGDTSWNEDHCRHSTGDFYISNIDVTGYPLSYGSTLGLPPSGGFELVFTGLFDPEGPYSVSFDFACSATQTFLSSSQLKLTIPPCLGSRKITMSTHSGRQVTIYAIGDDFVNFRVPSLSQFLVQVQPCSSTVKFFTSAQGDLCAKQGSSECGYTPGSIQLRVNGQALTTGVTMTTSSAGDYIEFSTPVMLLDTQGLSLAYATSQGVGVLTPSTTSSPPSYTYSFSSSVSTSGYSNLGYSTWTGCPLNGSDTVIYLTGSGMSQCWRASCQFLDGSQESMVLTDPVNEEVAAITFAQTFDQLKIGSCVVQRFIPGNLLNAIENTTLIISMQFVKMPIVPTYQETFIWSAILTGPFAAQAVNFTLIREGDWVYMKFTNGRFDTLAPFSGSETYIQSSNLMEPRFRPKFDMRMYMAVMNGGARYHGQIQISDDGYIRFYRGGSNEAFNPSVSISLIPQILQWSIN